MDATPQTNPGDVEKRCQACGAPFACGAASGDCWCAALPRVPIEAAAFDDCLCPDCLAAAQRREPA